MLLAGVDIGYNYVKAEPGDLIFPSVVGPALEGTFSLHERRRMSIRINGERWNVGNSALRHSAYASGRRDAEWLFTEPYRVLFCTALSELTEKSGTQFKIVMGLPLQHYNALAKQASAQFPGEYRFNRGPRWQTVEVEDVFMVTQPYGSLLDKALTATGAIQDEMWATSMVGVCDIGGNTLNLLIADNLEEEERWTEGNEFGLLKVLDQIGKAIRVRFPGISPKAQEVAVWVAKGTVPYKGEEHTLDMEIKRHLAPLCSLVVDRVTEIWREPGRLSGVLLTGGGSMLLGDTLAPMLSKAGYPGIVVGDNFGNARGYYKLARRLWGA